MLQPFLLQFAYETSRRLPTDMKLLPQCQVLPKKGLSCRDAGEWAAAHCQWLRGVTGMCTAGLPHQLAHAAEASCTLKGIPHECAQIACTCESPVLQCSQEENISDSGLIRTGSASDGERNFLMPTNSCTASRLSYRRSPGSRQECSLFQCTHQSTTDSLLVLTLQLVAS